MVFVRIGSVLTSLLLANGLAAAQGAKPTDPQIAHIAYTAGLIDIEAAKLALQKSKNKDVVAFATNMETDHKAVNDQALALVKKLDVTPEDNDTSKVQTGGRQTRRTRQAQRCGFRQSLHQQRGCLSQDRQRGAGEHAHSVGEQSGTQRAAEDRTENLSGSRAACRARCGRIQVRPRAMGREMRARMLGACLLAFAGGPARAETIQVGIEKLAFVPPQVAAHVGDTIQWVNADFVAHTATARNGAWDVMIPAGATKSVALQAEGTVDYVCKFHPNMTGRIAVAK
jgi:predicted outer membrane protein/plastocyanin